MTPTAVRVPIESLSDPKANNNNHDNDNNDNNSTTTTTTAAATTATTTTTTTTTSTKGVQDRDHGAVRALPGLPDIV